MNSFQKLEKIVASYNLNSKVDFNKFEKYMYINPFDSNMLPRHKWEVSWDSVNIMADNGQYTEEWKESYSKSAKTVAYFKNGGR